MITKIEQKNLLCAIAIHSGVDVLLNATATQEQKCDIRANLNIIFKNIMPYLRGDEKDDNLPQAAKSIKKIHSSLKGSPCAPFMKKAAKFFDLNEAALFLATLPALCKAIWNEIKTYESHEEAPWFERFNDVAGVICRGEPLSAVSKQLLFIQDVLKIPAPEFTGDEICHALTEALLTEGGSFSFNRTFTEDFVYSIFHKVRLSELMEQYQEKGTQNTDAALQALIEEYGTDNPNMFINDPFYYRKKERATFVKGLQKYTLETLVLTKKFLDEQGLRFYLTEGTLLGAVRHNGFIPWDDDVDIAMLREDYDRLVKLAKEGKIPPELNFDALENNPKHWVLGGKMQLVRKTPYIQHKVTKLSRCNGPYVDIFPIDYWNRPAGLKFAIANICVKASRRLLFMKTGYSVGTKKKPLRILGRMILPFLKNSWIEKFAIRNMKKFYGGNHKYAVNLCSYYPYYKEVFPTSFFGEPVYIYFEGEQMPVPCEYDYMLKTVYGKSYDTIPPVRVTNMRKHAFELNDEVQ
ncbi:MAG: LicD family protein [Clostridia bacterium]|nr:LicD family protein [Clostridia bacterium]